MGNWRGIWCLASVVLLAGCGVQRTMLIQSDPPGALVELNGEQVGRTPVSHDFLWYGHYDVTLHKDGYQTLSQVTEVKAPWWQWIPIDLLAEVMPFRPEDRQLFTYNLQPATTQPVDKEAILNRASAMEVQLEATRVEEPTTRESALKGKKSSTTRSTHPGKR